MARLEPPSEYEKLHSYIVEIAKETHLFTESYARGIDNLDSELIEISTEHLKNLTALLQGAASELERIKNNP
jgi:hypothetical protein